MSLSPKHTERIPVYFTEAQYIDLLKSAARFDKKPSEFIRFEVLRAMYGSMGMSAAVSNDNSRAFEGHDE